MDRWPDVILSDRCVIQGNAPLQAQAVRASRQARGHTYRGQKCMPGPGTGKAPPAIASDTGGGQSNRGGEGAGRHQWTGTGAGSGPPALAPFPFLCLACGLAAVPGPGQPGQGLLLSVSEAIRIWKSIRQAGSLQRQGPC